MEFSNYIHLFFQIELNWFGFRRRLSQWEIAPVKKIIWVFGDSLIVYILFMPYYYILWDFRIMKFVNDDVYFKYLIKWLTLVYSLSYFLCEPKILIAVIYEFSIQVVLIVWQIPV